MPLRAYIDGEVIIAPLLGVAAWDALRQDVADGRKAVVLPCCGGRGHLRRGRRGTQHFYHHSNGGCTWAFESAPHLAAKAEIALSCHAAGYQVRTEAVGPDWRADLLATNGTSRIAFEVQWTAIALAETAERQRRYRRDGIRGCWFFRQPPPDLIKARRDLPLFELLPAADGTFSVSSRFINDRPGLPIPLATFLGALLQGHIRYCASTVAAPRQSLRLTFAPYRCWRCGRQYHIYYVPSPYRSSCGRLLRAHGDERRAAQPALQAAIRDLLDSPTGRGITLGRLSPPRDPLADQTRRTFRCPHCAAPLRTAAPRSQKAVQARPDRDTPPLTIETALLLPRSVSISDPHWCYPPDGTFCDQVFAPYPR